MYILAQTPGIKSPPAQRCVCACYYCLRDGGRFMFSRLLTQLILSFLLVAGTAATCAAQQTAPTAPNQPLATRSPEVSPGQSASSTANATDSQAVAYPAYLTPVAGYQGVLAETVDGATIASQAVDERFNPASAVKLATAFAALHTFGPEHRFVTAVWRTGTLDAATGTVNGDLIVTGRDPSFHYEHAVMLARQLNDLGIRTVTGNLIIAPGFTMNFSWNAKRSGEDFRDTLDAARRSGAATRAWLDERQLVNDNASLSSVPSVVIAGEVVVDAAPPGAVPLLMHKSSKLVDVLKVLLCYSNNFMAERIGDTLGGPQGVMTAVTKSLNINPDEVSLSSTSGLGINRVTPRAMMKILRALRVELAKNKLALTDILPVAGIDPGTLEQRYTDPLERGSVVAKTGTLVYTDGGASSLVGQMKTKTGRIVLFVIMNQRGSVIRFRENQDRIVAAIQNSLGGPAPFDYLPVKLSMRLADSKSETAKNAGEYEPKDQ
jgi:D-alanyl-D-alanine carboxypeptidase/D-alanyl-D-alanine-endopeptidase (penicillin-binding protein 4)